MIQLIPSGGLGNQLFQIATVLNYVKRNGVHYIFGIIPINCVNYPFSETDVKEEPIEENMVGPYSTWEAPAQSN